MTVHKEGDGIEQRLDMARELATMNATITSMDQHLGRVNTFNEKIEMRYESLSTRVTTIESAREAIGSVKEKDGARLFRIVVCIGVGVSIFLGVFGIIKTKDRYHKSTAIKDNQKIENRIEQIESLLKK